jgi:hypothetical protein
MTIESFGGPSGRLVVTDSVKIFRGGLTGTAGLALFLPEGDTIRLYRSP